MTRRSPFRYFRTGSEIIRLAVMMHVRFPLSLRNVEDLLHERGIDVSHETVRFWWNGFGPMFAPEIRRRRVGGMRSGRWRRHLDEVFVKINGERHYLWRAADHEGEVLECFVTKRRDRKATLKFLKKSLKRQGHAHEFATDRLRSYGAAMGGPGIRDRQRTGRWMNNRTENSHQPFRRRERAMLGFRRMRTLRKFATVHASVFNHLDQERSLYSRNTFKTNTRDLGDPIRPGMHPMQADRVRTTQALAPTRPSVVFPDQPKETPILPEIPKSLQQEVDDLIDRIAAFQAANGRKVARAFKRTRKGRPLLEELDQFGLPLPADFCAMYWNHNGADPGATMTWHEMAVFLDHLWPGPETVTGCNKVTRARKDQPRPDRIWMADEQSRHTSLELKPAEAVAGKVPILATKAPRSTVTWIAFDCPLSMLQTVVATQEAGILSCSEGRIPVRWTKWRRSPKRTTSARPYWTALARGEVDFQMPPVDVETPDNGPLAVEPAVAKIMTESLRRR